MKNKKALLGTLQKLILGLFLAIVLFYVIGKIFALGSVFGKGGANGIGILEKEYAITTEFSKVKVNDGVYQLRLPKDIKQNPENIAFFVKKNNKIIDCNGDSEGNVMLIKGDKKGKVCCADPKTDLCVELINYNGKKLEARVKVTTS